MRLLVGLEAFEGFRENWEGKEYRITSHRGQSGVNGAFTFASNDKFVTYTIIFLPCAAVSWTESCNRVSCGGSGWIRNCNYNSPYSVTAMETGGYLYHVL